jgi:hypothetical protein
MAAQCSRAACVLCRGLIVTVPRAGGTGEVWGVMRQLDAEQVHFRMARDTGAIRKESYEWGC